MLRYARFGKHACATDLHVETFFLFIFPGSSLRTWWCSRSIRFKRANSFSSRKESCLKSSILLQKVLLLYTVDILLTSDTDHFTRVSLQASIYF